MERINTTNDKFSSTLPFDVESKDALAQSTRGHESLERSGNAINRDATETRTADTIELGNSVARAKTLRVVDLCKCVVNDGI